MQTGQQQHRQHIHFGRNYGQELTPISDTAVTSQHHDDAKRNGITELDRKLMDRELARLTNKSDYEAHYFDSL
jgi:hypothetical protein